MFSAINRAYVGAKIAVQSLVNRFRKEEQGGAEVIATLIIIAVVLVLALAFRDKLSELVKSLWNGMQTMGEEGGTVSLPTWE